MTDRSIPNLNRENEQSLATRFGISEGVALGAATAAGYLYAFSYESGYLSHYSVPSWLIQLSLVNVLLAFGAIAFVLIVAAYTMSALPAGPWWALLYQLSLLALPIGFTAFVFAVTDWSDWRSIFVAFLIGLFPALYALNELRKRLIAPIFMHKDTPRWADRWASAFNAQREQTRKSDLLGHSIRAMLRAGLRQSWLILFWLIFVIGPFAARYLGVGAAYFKTRHAVVAAEDECIAVRRYADYVICSQFDRKGKRIQSSFRLVRVGAPEMSLLRIEELGRMSAP